MSKDAQRARMAHARKVQLANKARQASEGNYGKMSRGDTVKLVESLLKSKQTPVQYIAPLTLRLSELNMWQRQSDDGKSRVQLDDMMRKWKLDDAGEYAGLLNQVRSDNSTLCKPLNGPPGPLSPIVHESACPTRGHVCPSCVCVSASSSALSAADGKATGGSPQGESSAESLDPLTRRDSPEKLSQVVDSGAVSGLAPVPEMWEEE